MNVVVIIPAKGDSKRLEKKNIKVLWGKTLLEWAFEACKESKMVTDVFVSTEDPMVNAVCVKNDVKVIYRPEELCGDVYKQAVIRHAAGLVHQFYDMENTLWISLQANSPQVTGKMLDDAILKMNVYKRDEVFSVDHIGNQNAAFRIFRGQYVFQRDLSTNCGTAYADVVDVHDEEDIFELSKLVRGV